MIGKARYIAIEGPIGVGKSSLSNLLAKKFEAEPIYEKVDENPFLGKFYQSRDQFAFQTQLFFLVSRYKQLSELAQVDIFKRMTICDYVMERDLIFAQINLSEDEYKLYLDIYNLFSKRVPKPDLVIYLQADDRILMKRIVRRGRDIENSISENYIRQVNRTFNEFFFNYRKTPLLIINTNEIDFVANEDDLEKLVIKVTGDIVGQEFFNPLSSLF